MCRKHLEPILGKRKKQSTLCRWLIVLVVFSFVCNVQAQDTNTTKPTKRTTDTSHKKVTTTIPKAVVPPKKDSAIRRRTPTVGTNSNVVKDTSTHRKAVTQATKAKPDSSAKKKALAPTHVFSQKAKDSIAKRNAAIANGEGLNVANGKQPFFQKVDPLFEKAIMVPHLPLKEKAFFIMDELHTYEAKDILFFIVCGLFLLYGIVRTAFPKYTDSLFRNLFAFSSIDKSDTNMGQNNLPSLLMNILFCLSLGLLSALMIEQVKPLSFPLWQIWLFGSIVLASIYLVKFLTIYLSGWIFNASSDASAYMYVVFLVNKIIGVLCLPAILILAFANNPLLNQYIATIGSILLIVLLLYRYVVTFSVIARNLQLNALHFFLYLCSVEIIPILVLYKLFFKDLIHKI